MNVRYGRKAVWPDAAGAHCANVYARFPDSIQTVDGKWPPVAVIAVDPVAMRAGEIITKIT
jgi:hypothetical protein